MPRASLVLLPLLLSVSCCSLENGDAARRVLNAPGRDASLPFSDGVLVGDTYFVAGTLGLDASGAVPASVEEEVRLMLDDFRGKLALADMTMDDLVMVQVFCSDVSLYRTFNEIYRTYFEGPFPSRAFVGSGTLLRGAHFEINGIAVARD